MKNEDRRPLCLLLCSSEEREIDITVRSPLEEISQDANCAWDVCITTNLALWRGCCSEIPADSNVVIDGSKPEPAGSVASKSLY
jgi:hypothetical protein